LSTFISSIFADRNFAEMAVAKLETLGYKRDDISVLMDNTTRAKSFSQDTGTTAIDGHQRGAGAAVAATLGGALGAIVAGAALLGSVRLRSSEDDRVPPGQPTDIVAGLRADGDVELVSVNENAPPLEIDESLVAGPLRALVAAAGAGGILGALAGAGLAPDLAKRYERELAAGGMLIGVHARPGDDARVREALHDVAVGTKPSTQ